MQFISEEKLQEFKNLGYSFSTYYTGNNLGSTYHVAVMDREGNEVVHASSSYANGSGHGYAMSGAETEAVARLEEYIKNPNPNKEEDINWDFLSDLCSWGYITEYGYDKDGVLTILFDTWEQLEGREDRETGEKRPSVFAKFVKLAEEGKLKPSINYTLTHFESAFTDEYMRCDRCGRIMHTQWDGIRYVEGTCEILCDDCINESESAIESLIDEAKDDFSKALPVMISEDKLAEMGYEKLDENSDFSTRAEQWGEYAYGSHNVHHAIIEELCQKYDGFPKLTGVWQFDAEYNAYFPTDTIEQARLDLKEMTGIGAEV